MNLGSKICINWVSVDDCGDNDDANYSNDDDDDDDDDDGNSVTDGDY